MRAISVAIFLSLIGCTVNLEDKRLTRQEVAEAFKERDSIITGAATMLKEHEERLNKLEGSK